LSAEILTGIHAADALGRSYVVRKDKYFSDQKKTISAKFKVGKYFTRADGIKWIVAADTPSVQISFNLTPQLALQYFQQKAFWISGIENQRFIDAVKGELERVLSEGLTYDQFADSFKKFFIEYGITPENTIRLDTIFRTNLFAAYTAGQVKQVDEVRDQFPVWRYISVIDNRTHPSHMRLNGHYFRREPYPPIWYNCRCTPQFIHSLQLDQLGAIEIHNTIFELIDSSEVIDFVVNDGFDQWVSDNPVSPGIQSIVEGGSN
jgi:SPP1 gp7 family putative phage head morphogenesis protein